jgi:hypothetical protein
VVRSLLVGRGSTEVQAQQHAFGLRFRSNQNSDQEQPPHPSEQEQPHYARTSACRRSLESSCRPPACAPDTAPADDGESAQQTVESSTHV